MKEESKLKKVIIGSEDTKFYAYPILVELENQDEIEVSAIGSNINKMERIVKLMTGISITEKERRREPFNDTTALIIKLEKKKVNL